MTNMFPHSERSRLRRVACTAAVLVVGAVGLAACSSSQSGTSTSTNTGAVATGATGTIKVAYAPNVDPGFYYALDSGMFAKNGITVQTTEFTTASEMVPALTAGSVDVGGFGVPPLINANARGQALQVFNVATNQGSMSALYVRPTSGIASMADLAGKTVATQKGSIHDIILHAALKKANVSDSSVKIEYLDPSAVVAGYVRGDLDAVFSYAVPGARLLAAGAKIAVDDNQIGIPDAAIYAASPKYISSHAALLANFVKTINAANDIVKGDEQIFGSMLQKYAHLNSDQTTTIYKYLANGLVQATDLVKPTYALSLTPGGGFEKVLTALQSTMVTMGVLTQSSPNITNLYTDVVVQAATK